MLEKFKKYISKLSSEDQENDNPDEDKLSYACSALLIETAFADKKLSSSELETIRNTLQKVYSLKKETIQEIIDQAEESVKDSTSLYNYTKIINESLEYADKLRLINSLWQVAYADGELDKYEEHLIRKIADLIHISHKDFILEKLKVKTLYIK